MITKQRWLSWSALPLSFLLALPFPLLGQRPLQETTSGPLTEKATPKVPDTGLPEAQLPAFAVSLVITLATEVRSYSDVALRSRVLARAADVPWDADHVNARELFKRAWEEAEKGDADDVTIKTKDNPPAMVTALRRMSGRDLRFEILSVMAKRDRSLAEEFFSKFFRVAASILLRPLPASEKSSSTARHMKFNVIRRLLPLFEQYVPETGVTLRASLVELVGSSRSAPLDPADFTLTQGIKPPPSADDTVEQMQSRIDRAKTSRERVSIYASAASALLAQGDERARDIADKIEDPERRTQIRQHIDFEFVQLAIKKKAVSEAIRLAQTGKMSNT